MLIHLMIPTFIGIIGITLRGYKLSKTDSFQRCFKNCKGPYPNINILQVDFNIQRHNMLVTYNGG